MKTARPPVAVAVPALPWQHQFVILLALLTLVGLTFWLLPQAVGSLWPEARYTAQRSLAIAAPAPTPAPDR